MLKRSATHLAVEAEPNGSTFVNPASVPAAPAAAKLTGSKPHNYLAG